MIYNYHPTRYIPVYIIWSKEESRFVEKTLLGLIALTFVIHLIDTLAYSVRLNSVKSGQMALSFSLFNLLID